MRYLSIMDHFDKKTFMFIQVFFYLLFFITPSVKADILTCSGNSSVGGSYTVASGSTNVTAPRAPTTDLYGLNRSRMGASTLSIKCSGDYRIEATLIDVPTNTLYGDNITQNASPTTNADIATVISVSDDEDFSGNSIKTWPDVSAVAGSFTGGTAKNIALYITVRIKLNFPGALPVIPPGIFGSFSGPTIAVYITPNNAGDTINTCPSGSTRLNGNNRTCIVFSRLITSPGTHIYSGTCEMLIPNKIVKMGQHPGVSGTHSAWKDASFDIKCPQAWGYTAKMFGGSNPDNDIGSKGKVTQNGALTISISPYTPLLPAFSGAFALDGAGATGYATGYGIQLAWGPPSVQISGNAMPSKPVDLGAPSLLNLANANYTTGAYTPGSQAIPNGTDGRVYMSARYVRTTEPFQPGVANGKVEVIVSYN